MATRRDPTHSIGAPARKTDTMTRLATTLLLLASVITTACGERVEARQAAAPPCAPVDSAWAAQLRALDANTGRPVADAAIYFEMHGARTDSAGWVCIRDLVEPKAAFEIARRGYEGRDVTVRGVIGTTVRQLIEMRRVPRPCCDLRGRWRITMHLDSPAGMNPKPAGRVVSGEVDLGPRWLAPQEGDDLDSLVRPVRGLHRLDFTPFFGGQVAPDVSRSVFGSGPDLLHEVEAVVSAGDSVSIGFIPRMTHGSIWLAGRIRRDTIRGRWVQSAFAEGARGRFEMVRTAPPDSGGSAVTPPRSRNRADERSSAAVPPRTIPASHWRPQLAVAPDGALWLASGGLFVADSLYGPWRRVFGSDTDPVEADELRIGISMAFIDSRTAFVGLDYRYPNASAPVVYRTGDGGAHWVAVPLNGLHGVRALDALGRSVWLVAREPAATQTRILVSDDGGARWSELATPTKMTDAEYLFRLGRDTAYMVTSSYGGSPALWGTIDGGHHWTPVATPHDQGLQHVRDGYERVSELASVGRWIVVREAGHVFARSIDDSRWRPLPGIEHIASERGGRQLFALTDDLRPEMLDSSLRVVWRAPETMGIPPRGVEQVLMRNGAGYVSVTHGNVLEASPRSGARWLAPQSRTSEATKQMKTEIMVKP